VAHSDLPLSLQGNLKSTRKDLMSCEANQRNGGKFLFHFLDKSGCKKTLARK
jgi:hypothetical protein